MYELVKIENQSRKRSHTNQNVSIFSDSVYNSVAYDPVKTVLSELEAETEEPANRMARSRALSLVYSSASACDSDNAVFT